MQKEMKPYVRSTYFGGIKNEIQSQEYTQMLYFQEMHLQERS